MLPATPAPAIVPPRCSRYASWSAPSSPADRDDDVGGDSGGGAGGRSTKSSGSADAAAPPASPAVLVFMLLLLRACVRFASWRGGRPGVGAARARRRPRPGTTQRGDRVSRRRHRCCCRCCCCCSSCCYRTSAVAHGTMARVGASGPGGGRSETPAHGVRSPGRTPGARGSAPPDALLLLPPPSSMHRAQGNGAITTAAAADTDERRASGSPHRIARPTRFLPDAPAEQHAGTGQSTRAALPAVPLIWRPAATAAATGPGRLGCAPCSAPSAAPGPLWRPGDEPRLFGDAQQARQPLQQTRLMLLLPSLPWWDLGAKRRRCGHGRPVSIRAFA